MGSSLYIFMGGPSYIPHLYKYILLSDLKLRREHLSMCDVICKRARAVSQYQRQKNKYKSFVMMTPCVISGLVGSWEPHGFSHGNNHRSLWFGSLSIKSCFFKKNPRINSQGTSLGTPVQALTNELKVKVTRLSFDWRSQRGNDVTICLFLVVFELVCCCSSFESSHCAGVAKVSVASSMSGFSFYVLL